MIPLFIDMLLSIMHLTINIRNCLFMLRVSLQLHSLTSGKTWKNVLKTNIFDCSEICRKTLAIYNAIVGMDPCWHVLHS